MKEAKDLYTENFHTMKKNLKMKSDDGNTPVSWIKRINVVILAILPKVVHRFHTIPIKISKRFFIELEKSIQKFIWKHKDPRQLTSSLGGRASLKGSYYLASNHTTGLQGQWQHSAGTRPNGTAEGI